MNRFVSSRLLIPLLLGLIASPASARVHLGLLGGAVRSGLSGDAPPNAGYENHVALAGGLTGEIDLSRVVRLSVQPMFQERGVTVSYEVKGLSEPWDSLFVRMDYISVPVLIKVFSGSGRTFASGGFEFGFLRSATLEYLTADVPDEDVKNFFHDVDVAMAFGFGGVFPINRWSVWVEGRYSQSVPNLSRSGEEPETSGLPERFRNTGLQFFVGVSLPLGNEPSAAGGGDR